MRRLTKKRDIPFINALVDIGNLVSIRYGLSIAAVDRRAVRGTITVHFAEGTEAFTNLNASEVDHPEPGEVIFTDESHNVIARRWCWRQSDATARDDSTKVLFTIEGHHTDAAQDVRAAMVDLQALLERYAGGTYQSFMAQG